MFKSSKLAFLETPTKWWANLGVPTRDKTKSLGHAHYSATCHQTVPYFSFAPTLSCHLSSLSLSLNSLSRLNTHITCLMSCREREERECMCNQVSSKERSGFATNPQLGKPPKPPTLILSTSPRLSVLVSSLPSSFSFFSLFSSLLFSSLSFSVFPLCLVHH